MQRKLWQAPRVDMLDVKMTMAGKGTWIDFKGNDANEHTPAEFPGKGNHNGFDSPPIS